ncbi:MAG: extracellular solute-binding protein [Treponema sp.]|nr:extracellular solute-binding protein [Treponema sp.]
MKRFFLGFLVVLLTAGLPFLTGCNKKKTDSSESVVLTLGAWRPDDTAQLNAILAEYKKISGVTVEYRPINPPDYNATLRLQLEGGTGPDLMYARSYAAGQELYRAGYFADCSDIPGVKENFTASNRAPWAMPDGTVFAVPFVAVSHAVYYNKDIFTKEGLSVPQSWEDFLALCETLQSRGYTPLANGVGEEWDILETFFLGMLPNFIGTSEERAQYESGALKLNDDNWVAAFQAMADVGKYLPGGYEAVTYNDSQALFATGQAVMFMDGSWTAGTYGGAAFEWGVFAMPAPRGKKTAITFHADGAIAYNKATKYPKECRDFLAWVASVEGATICGNYLPAGMFPLISAPLKLDDPHVNEFLALNTGKDTDVRFVWPKFMDLYSPMNQAVIQVIKGAKTSRQAADEMEAAAAGLR